MALISTVANFLGFGEEGDAPVRPTSSLATTERPSAPRVTQLRSRRGVEQSEIFSIEPDSYLASGELIASHFRDGVTVIVNMAKLSDSEALRMVDFLSGLKLALLGNIKRITKHVYLLTPASVGINDPDPAEEVVDSLLIQP